jgi:predicted dehydrogenase
MSRGGKDTPLRVGIAGLDHWYIALDAAKAAAGTDGVELVVIAHRDGERAQEVATRYGATEATTDIGSVARRDDLDILVTACRSSENPDLCIEAASKGTNILSVKPIAMSRQESVRIRAAVKEASVRFMSWESVYRVRPAYRQAYRWLDEGKIGAPISASYVMRGSVPRQIWPDVPGATWWTDPAHVPGGGWIDHAIYAVDFLRWMFDGEVTAVSGAVANLVDRSLPAGLEDFGLATAFFSGGQIASIEVTWTAAPGASTTTLALVGSEGSIMLSSHNSGVALVSGQFEPAGRWTSITLPSQDEVPLTAMVRVLREGGDLPASVDDACRNLDACLSFYDAARDGCTREIVNDVVEEVRPR